MKKKFLLSLILIFIFCTSTYSTTIRFWHSWSNEEASILSSVVAKYEALSGNKVIMQGIPFGAFQTRFSTMSARGDVADVIVGPPDWLGLFAEQNLIEPLTSFNGGDTSGFIKEAIAPCYYKGKLYGLPESVRTIVLFYNRKLISIPPANTREMINKGTAITDDGEGVYGLVYDRASFYYHIPWITGFGGKIINETNNRPTFTSKEQIAALRFLRNLNTGAKKIMPAESTNFEMTMMMFNQGMAGMMINGNWVLGDLKKTRLDFGVAKLPVVSETGLPAKPVAGSEIFMMSSKSKQKEAAYNFIQFITSSDIQSEFVKAGHIPSRDDVYEMKKVRTSGFYNELQVFKAQLADSIPMPNVPEMNYGIWDQGNSMVQELLNTNNSYEDVTRDAQNTAVRRIIQSQKK